MHKVIVAGANGKMGKIVVAAINNHQDFTIIDTVIRGEDLASKLVQNKPDILIDVTLPEFAFEHAKLALIHGVKPIIGTSGINKETVHELSKINNNTGGIIAPNFSLSAILMLKFAELAAPYFQHADIIEQHHLAKIDAPSGTAINTAEIINTNSIHSIRRPGVVAKQTVLFANANETLEITQESINRDSFTSGIQFACEQVLEQTSIIYGLQNLITGKAKESVL